MDFLLYVLWWTWHAVEMGSFCLLASMALILTPNHSSLYLLSNDMNSYYKFIQGRKKLQL